MTRTLPDGTEHAMAAIRGMDKALRADWMDPRGGTYDGNL